jgi:hypothetical protein
VARNGIAVKSVQDGFHQFCADLTDTQHDQIRHEPNVYYVSDDFVVYLA